MRFIGLVIYLWIVTLGVYAIMHGHDTRRLGLMFLGVVAVTIPRGIFTR